MNQASTRELLLEAARALFVSRGFHAVSTRAIAEQAGVNLGAIQYHFGSKENLFIATIHTIWGADHAQTVDTILTESVTTKVQAAEKFGKFVAAFLYDLLHPVGPQPCRLMFRELFAELDEESEMCAALITSVVEKFISPVDSKLLSLLKFLFADASEQELSLITNSVIGQCFFYMTHRAFLCRLRAVDYAEDPHCLEVISFIIRFTLASASRSKTITPVAIEAATTFYDILKKGAA